MENRRKTVGKTAGKLPETTGKTAVEPLENRWKTAGKTAVEPPENRQKTAVEPAEKTVGKPLENRREKPRFWVTFASLNKGLEWLEKASPASFFGPWGGLP